MDACFTGGGLFSVKGPDASSVGLFCFACFILRFFLVGRWGGREVVGACFYLRDFLFLVYSQVEVQDTANCFEQNPLPFTPRERGAVTPTSIKAKPQVELTPLKQVCERRQARRHRGWEVAWCSAHRCQFWWLYVAMAYLSELSQACQSCRGRALQEQPSRWFAKTNGIKASWYTDAKPVCNKDRSVWIFVYQYLSYTYIA